MVGRNSGVGSKQKRLERSLGVNVDAGLMADARYEHKTDELASDLQLSRSVSADVIWKRREGGTDGQMQGSH